MSSSFYGRGGDGGGSGGATSYTQLTNKPKINGVELRGNKTSADLNIAVELTQAEYDALTEEERNCGIIYFITDAEGGGGGSGSLENDIIVTNPIGKYDMNKVITQGTDFETIFRSMLSETYYPTLTNPSASLSYNAPAIAKVGENVSATAATVTLNRGSINPKYTAESSYRSGEATGYSIKLNDANVTYEENNVTGQFAVPAFTRTSAGTVKLVGTVNYAAGVQPKDSDGKNYNSPLAAGSVSATKTIQFLIPFYYGVNDSGTISTVAELESLTEDLSVKANKKYTYTTLNEYMIFAYDSSHGSLSSILDQNNFETISSWNKLTVGKYTVYITKLPTKDTGAEYTFKF